MEVGITYRLTTPTFTFTFPENFDMSVITPTNTYVTFSSKNMREIVTKRANSLEIGEHSIGVFLTQEETQSFPPGDIKAQINWVYTEGGVTKRACTNIVEINVKDNLYRDIIETS